MSLQEKIKNIIFFFIKKEYNNYLKINKIRFISEGKLYNVVDNLYNSKRKEIKSFIRNCLKEMMDTNYPGALVENIIYEIFQDEKLAKNRVILEISNYQKFLKKKNINSYNQIVNLEIDKKYGMGIRLDFSENDIVVKNFKRNPENNTFLSAEKNGNINIGDSVTSINNINLEILETSKIVELFKEILSKSSVIKLGIRSYKIQEVKNNSLSL